MTCWLQCHTVLHSCDFPACIKCFHSAYIIGHNIIIRYTHLTVMSFKLLHHLYMSYKCRQCLHHFGHCSPNLQTIFVRDTQTLDMHDDSNIMGIHEDISSHNDSRPARVQPKWLRVRIHMHTAHESSTGPLGQPFSTIDRSDHAAAC